MEELLKELPEETKYNIIKGVVEETKYKLELLGGTIYFFGGNFEDKSKICIIKAVSYNMERKNFSIIRINYH